MKRILFIISLFTLTQMITAQVATGVSGSGFVSITKEPPRPPYLEIVKGSVNFKDENGNNMIDAGEKAMIFFQLKNSGLGPGLNLKVSTTEKNEVPDIFFNKQIEIGQLKVGEEKQIQIPLSGGMNIPNGQALFNIRIDETNGFGSDPVEIEVATAVFKSPQVKVVDYTVTSESSKTLQRRKPFNVQVLIQNMGAGKAKNVMVKLPLPAGIFCLSGNKNLMIGNLEPGDTSLIVYNLVANNEYSALTIPLNIRLSESYGKYAENKTIELALNQELLAGPVTFTPKPKPETRPVGPVSLSSKVDKNIPYNADKNPNRIALIIGNEDYSETLNAEVNVEFARNDAETFRKYALNVLGVEEKNMHFLLDATAGQMQRKIDLVAAILQKLGNKGELIFYYAGHGYPDEALKTPYIIPVDVDATNLGSAIKLSDIYKKFGNSGAARVTVFLDACFSGGGRNQGLLAARGVAIKPKEETIPGNMVVFSAASGEQSALPYDAEKHGMFTYFLLDKLQQTKGNVTYGELADYLKSKVGLESLTVNAKPQDPEVNVSYRVENEWRTWKMAP